MTTNRLEAFSDGVFAIVITIMVLNLKTPVGPTIAALRPLVPTLAAYLVSFVYVGIYWNNHHHLFQAAQRINASILWANLALLFWLSLIPPVTAWVGANWQAAAPVATYGVLQLLAGISYAILQRALVIEGGRDSVLARAVGTDRKGFYSIGLYALAIGLAFVRPWLAEVTFVLTANFWLIPDRRISSELSMDHSHR